MNSATVDLYRNGGALGGDEPLEDHDGDEVLQAPKTEEEPTPPSRSERPSRPLAQTDGTSLVPAVTATAGVGAAGYLLVGRRVLRRFPWRR